MRLKLSGLAYLICLGSFLTASGIVGAQVQNSLNDRLSLTSRTVPTKSFSSFGRRLKKKSEVNTEARNGWLAETRRRLEQIQVSGEMKAARMKYWQSGLLQYWIDDEALLEFENEEWVYFVTHSGHLSDGVGSAILAVDNAGNLYTNQAHVCASITIETRKGQEFRKLSDFLEKKVDDSSWEKLAP